MIHANQINSIGVTSTMTSNGGKLSDVINHAYFSPYQIKYAGLLLKTASSTSYDSGATATYDVAVPCGIADRPEGWSYKSSTVDNQLPGATTAFYPLDADVGNSGYAEDEADFAPVTLCPFKNGEVIGVPLAASQTIVAGDIIATAADGLGRKGNSVPTVWIVGKALCDVTSAATVTPANVKFVPIRVDVYYKA